MSQTCPSDVVDLRCMEAVGDLLQGGIESIYNISMVLLNAHVDQNNGKCINYDQIWEHTQHAKQCLNTSEEMMKEILGNLNESMEHLINEEGFTENEKKEKNLAMDKLCKDKSCAEETIHHMKRALKQAEKNLVSEKEALKKEEARMNSSKSLSIAGAVLIAIPVAGWIAGPIMMSVGEHGMHDAINGIRTAEEEVRKAESEVREYNSRVTDYPSRITEAQKEINKTNEDLNKIQITIEKLMKHLADTAEIQETVRQAVDLLSILSGRVTVLQKQTNCFILWEPVVNLMKEVMKAAINIAGNQILYSRGLAGLINTLRENSERLLAICNSPNNSEHDSDY